MIIQSSKEVQDILLHTESLNSVYNKNKMIFEKKKKTSKTLGLFFTESGGSRIDPTYVYTLYPVINGYAYTLYKYSEPKQKYGVYYNTEYDEWSRFIVLKKDFTVETQNDVVSQLDKQRSNNRGIYDPIENEIAPQLFTENENYICEKDELLIRINSKLKPVWDWKLFTDFAYDPTGMGLTDRDTGARVYPHKFLVPSDEPNAKDTSTNPNYGFLLSIVKTYDDEELDFTGVINISPTLTYETKYNGTRIAALIYNDYINNIRNKYMYLDIFYYKSILLQAYGDKTYYAFYGNGENAQQKIVTATK